MDLSKDKSYVLRYAVPSVSDDIVPKGFTVT